MNTLPCEQKEKEEGWTEGGSQTHHHDEQTSVNRTDHTDMQVITKKKRV